MSSGSSYGSIVYWGTITGSVLVVLGSFIGLVYGSTWLPVEQQYELIMSGKVMANMPDRYNEVAFYYTGDGVILLGIIVAILSLVPAIVVTLPQLWRTNARVVALCGAINAALIVSAALFSFS